MPAPFVVRKNIICIVFHAFIHKLFVISSESTGLGRKSLMTHKLDKAMVRYAAARSAVRYLLPSLYLVVPSHTGRVQVHRATTLAQ